MTGERIFYSSSVHDDREIDAVVEVLRSGPQGLWPGRRVVRMEREVAARFGKAHGVMCNSGSSALYLALELLGLAPGAEVVTCALTFSTDVAPIVRGGWVPVFVDCEPLDVLRRRRPHRGDDHRAHRRAAVPQPHRQRARLGSHRRRSPPATTCR